MKDRFSSAALFLTALVLAPAVLADDAQLYKWTDLQGVVHYSDRPPTQPVADLQTSDLPVFPAVDQAKVDKEQAALIAEAAALQQLAQAQAAAQDEERAAAEQSAEAQPQPVVSVSDDYYSPVPIYRHSAFAPRVYRANLYLPRRSSGHTVSAPRPLPSRPPISLTTRP